MIILPQFGPFFKYLSLFHSLMNHPKNEKVWLTEGIQAIFQDPFGTFNPLSPYFALFKPNRERSLSCHRAWMPHVTHVG